MTKDAASSSNAPNGYVRSDVSNGIGRIEFFHPKSNALPSAVLRDLAAAVTAVGADPAARVLVLQSGGTGPFCAGASFDELTAINNAEQGQEFFSGFARVILAMIRAPKFVISRVHGKAAGGAVGLIAASDFSMAMAMLKRVFWAGTESWDQLLAERAAMSGTLVLSEFTRNAIGAFKSR